MLKKKLLHIAVCLLPLVILASCDNDPTAAKKQATEPSQNTARIKTPVSPTVASIDTQRPINPAPAPRKLKASETQPQDYGKLPGIKGFVIRDNAVLRTAPKQTSGEMVKLKKNEIIYILETTMKNEAGEQTPYPTWYKIERENKQQGWVLATAIDAGSGG